MMPQKNEVEPIRKRVFENAYERLVSQFTEPRYEEEVKLARSQFFDEAGVLDEADPALELRMTQFLDWYLMTRPLRPFNLTPAEYALELESFKIAPAEMSIYETLAIAHHSMFEFLRMRGRDVYVHDLFLEREIVVKDSPVNMGFNRGEVFEARLVPTGKEYEFALGFCIHPLEASGFIRTEISALLRNEKSNDNQRNLAARDALMLRLMKMRYKYEHYRHLKLDLVYSNEKKVRF